MKNNGMSSASPTVLPAAERREDERSETDRSTAAGKTVAAQPPSPARPDPEVVVDAKRRSFTAEYKLRILAEADAAAAQPETKPTENPAPQDEAKANPKQTGDVERPAKAAKSKKPAAAKASTSNAAPAKGAAKKTPKAK